MKTMGKKQQFIKNVSYSFIANLVSFLISVFMVMVVPKFLSVEDYGIWQLFLFYSSYLGFFHFGWEDGIYLRYAGKNFENLDHKLFAGQFYMVVFSQIILAFGISACASLFVLDPIKKMVLYCCAFILPFTNFNTLCNFIMQITNRIRDYAKMVLTERVFYFAGVCVLILLHKNYFIDFYAVRVVSLICVSFMGIRLCSRLLLPNFYPFKRNLIEAYENISAGSKLMFANIANMLIIGSVRFGISEGWDVSTFGRVSLTLGISNFLMIFIDSVSIVVFPALKHVENDRLPALYKEIRSGLTVLLLGVLLGYYPARYILSLWLPKYADSLIYMAVLFPICVFDSKVSLLINTYLKSLRQEALMLKINTVSVIVSVAVTFLMVRILHNLDLTILSIVLLYAFRCGVAEYYLSKLLQIHLKKDILIEMLMVLVFMASGWLLQNWICTAIYGIAYLLFLGMEKENVKMLWKKVRNTD
jgi:O-antigen/teichoic acid export membrane protein